MLTTANIYDLAYSVADDARANPRGASALSVLRLARLEPAAHSGYDTVHRWYCDEAFGERNGRAGATESDHRTVCWLKSSSVMMCASRRPWY